MKNWQIIRVSLFWLVGWNLEEVFRSFQNGWSYHFFFWKVGTQYWTYWTIGFGILGLLYLWSEMENGVTTKN